MGEPVMVWLQGQIDHFRRKCGVHGDRGQAAAVDLGFALMVQDRMLGWRPIHEIALRPNAWLLAHLSPCDDHAGWVLKCQRRELADMGGFIFADYWMPYLPVPGEEEAHPRSLVRPVVRATVPGA